jgi:hypothetical protein
VFRVDVREPGIVGGIHDAGGSSPFSHKTGRLAGFGLVLLGAVLVWGGTRAGGLAEVVQMAGYAALAAGWALMLAAIFLRTRHHRRRMAELDGGTP